MNSYERVQTTVSHTTPDRPPLQLMATDEVIGNLCAFTGTKTEEELLGSLGIDFRGLAYDIEKTQPIPEGILRHHGQQGRLSCTSYGVVLLENENFPQAHRVYGPFYETTDLDSFDWPTPADIQSSGQSADIERHNRNGYCTLVRCDNPFKIAYFMRPFEEFMIDCLAREDLAIALVERIAQTQFAIAEQGVRSGARCAMVYGDFAEQRSLMISPDAFRRVLKPILAELVARLRRINKDVLVFLHSDGNLWSILGDLIECGFDAVHPIQPECMDMQEVKRVYGNRLTLFGGASVQSELPKSDPEQIRRLVRQRIDSLGKQGGFMLSPSNSILPDVPPQSVVAMYDEGQRQRR